MDMFNEYFVKPVLADGGFNWLNTMALGLLLVVSALGVYKLLKKLGVPLDRYFAVSLLPFVYWDTTTRVLRDYFYHQASINISLYPGFHTDLAANISAISSLAYGHITSFLPLGPLASLQAWVIAWFTTPSTGSYVLTFLLALFTLLISLALQRQFKVPYWKSMIGLGLLYCAWNTVLLPVKTFVPLLEVLALTAAWAALFFGLPRLGRVLPALKNTRPLKLLREAFTNENSAILTAHMLDASATFISLSFYGYGEQHVLPNVLIPVIGPAAMFILKLAVVVPVLWYIDRETEKQGDIAGFSGTEFRVFLKVCVLILGLAPGLRDAIRLVAGV